MISIPFIYKYLWYIFLVDHVPEIDVVKLSEPRDDMKNPFWIEDQDVGSGQREELHEGQVNFWNGLIEKYLEPLPNDPDKQREVGKGDRRCCRGIQLSTRIGGD